MPERVAGLALGDRAEQGGHVRVALDVGLLGEVQVAAVRLALARERLLQVLVGLAALEIGHCRGRSSVVVSLRRAAEPPPGRARSTSIRGRQRGSARLNRTARPARARRSRTALLECSGEPRSVRPGRRPRAPRRRALRRARRRRRHHRRRRGPRRRLPGPAHRPGRAGRLRLGHVVEVVEAGPRRAALPAAGRRPPRLRGPRRAPAAAAQRPAPGAASCRSSSRCSRQGRRGHPKLARALGTALWMYDLTGGARIGKLHKRLIDATRRWPTCRRCAASGWRRRYLYYDAQADDARLTLDRRPHRGARPRRGRRQRRARSPGSRKDADGAAARASRSSADGAAASTCGAAVGGQRRRRVGRRRARPRRGHRPRHRSARPRASTSPCRGTRCATTSPPSSPCPRTSARSSSCRWGDRVTYIGTTDTDYDGPSTTRSARPRTSTTCSTPSTARSPSRITEADIVGTWAGLRPLVRDAGSGRTADLSRRHQVRQSDSGVVTDHRRQAHDLPRDGRGHRRRGRRAARATPVDAAGAPQPTKRLPLRGADGYDGAEATAVERLDRRAASSHLADRYGGEARGRARHGRAPTRPGRAARARPPLPAGRGRLRRPLRDGPHARRRAVAAAPGPGSWPATPRPPRRADVAALIGRRARLGRRRASRQVDAYRAASRHERDAADLPEIRSAGADALPAPDAMTDPASRVPGPLGTGRADPADRARRRRGRGRHRAGSAGAARSRCPTPSSSGCAPACAEVTTDPAALAEASRDWWPLAMTWALDGQVAGAGRRRRPARRPPSRWPRCSRICNEARVPVTAAGGRSGVCGGSVPSHGGVVLDLCRPHGHRRRRRRPRSCSTCCAGTFGDDLEDDLRAEHGVTARPLAPVDGALDRRRLAGVPVAPASTRPATARSRTWSSASTWRWPTARSIHTGGRPARRSAPTSPSCSSAPRARSASSPGPGCGCTRPRRTSGGPPTAFASLRRRARRLPAHPAAGRHARPCCACTTPSRPTAASRPATGAAAARARRGRPGARRRRRSRSSPRSADGAGAEPARRRLVERWLGHRNDVSALEALIARGLVVDTMEIAGAVGGAAGHLRRQRSPPSRGVDGTLAASAHQSHAYTDGALPLLHLRRPAPTPTSRDALLPRRVGRRHPRRCSPRRRPQPPPRRRPQPGPLRAPRRSAAAFDVLVALKARARPQRHPEPRQARPARRRSARCRWPWSGRSPALDRRDLGVGQRRARPSCVPRRPGRSRRRRRRRRTRSLGAAPPAGRVAGLAAGGFVAGRACPGAADPRGLAARRRCPRHVAR